MDRSRSQGWRWQCHACLVEAGRRYYASHRESAVARTRRWQREHEAEVTRNNQIQNKRKKARRDAVIAAERRERGNRCEKCGGDGRLHWHHLDPTSKVETIGRMRSEGYSLSALEKELGKCLLLCHSCHVEAHRTK